MTSWYRTEGKGDDKVKSLTYDPVEHTITLEKTVDPEPNVAQWGWHDIPTLQEKIEEPEEEIETTPLSTASTGRLSVRGAETTPLPPVKKPRGRPRKNATDKAPEKPKAKAKAEAKPKAKVQTEDKKADDPVEAPSHYCKGGYELGPMLYVWGLSHRRASAVEYIMRAGSKETSDEAEDLRKAIRNLQMELEYMEKYGQV